MQRESQKDRTIMCHFDPTEVGIYVIHVRWSEQHVPGSPFQVRAIVPFHKDFSPSGEQLEHCKLAHDL